MAIRIPFSILCFALLVLFTHAEDHSVNFSYSGTNGPDRWGLISPSFSTCSNGKSQSPVDLRKQNIIVHHTQLSPLHRHYHSGKATLVNNGFNIGVHFEEEVGYVSIDAHNYSLKQMHWHSPSEHRLNGHQMDAELHIVHRNEEGSFAVVGVLFKLGDSDPIISKMEEKLVELGKQKGGYVELGSLDLNVRQMKRRSRKYYRYMGSLTTPPCKENVSWTILGKVRSISQKQLQLLKAPLSTDFKNNARPVQPLNGRNIDMYSLSLAS